jgi:hypothetical protein
MHQRITTVLQRPSTPPPLVKLQELRRLGLNSNIQISKPCCKRWMSNGNDYVSASASRSPKKHCKRASRY